MDAGQGRPKIDVVYHLGTGSKAKNFELRYALRALEQNFLDLGKVYVVGFRPKWLTGAVHLPMDDVHRHNKDANLIDKVLLACRSGVTETFLRSSDDEVLLMPSHLEDLLPLHFGDLKTRKESFWHSGWKKRLRATMELLASRGLPTLHFDTHVPKVYNRESFQRLMAGCDYARGNGYTIDTLYLNQIGLVDPPHMAGEKLTLEGSSGLPQHVRQQLQGKRYLGYNDGGLSGGLKQVLKEMFPNPSRFEKEGVKVMQGIGVEEARPIPTVIAVVGTPRSGTSCTAGLIHYLGVSMGEHLRQANERNPRGFFEDIPLRKVCAARCSSDERVNGFRAWAIERVPVAGMLIGGKDGKLCNQIPEMVRACPDLKVVAVNRPLAAVVNSMEKGGSFSRMNRQQMESLAVNWVAHRDRDLAKFNVKCLTLEYDELIANPSANIDKLIAFLEITPTPLQRMTASGFVTGMLRHNVAGGTP